MSYQSKKQKSLLSFSFKKGDNPRYFYALCAIKFLLSITFTLFKIQKTSNVVLKSGAESMPSIKLIIFFVAVFATYIYARLNNRMSYQQVSYCLLGFFFGAFALYAFVICPNLDALKPDIKQLPASCKIFFPKLVELYGDWPIVFFYLLAELFGQFCIVVFFWGAANDLYNKQQAKRFYQWFIAAGCLGGAVGSLLAKRIVRLAKAWLPTVACSKDKLDRMLLEKSSEMISILALVLIICIGLIYKYLRDHIPPSKITVEKQRQKKPSFIESIRLIYTNSYLIALAVMIISCGVCMNIVQVTYKGYLKTNAKNDVVTYVDYEAYASLWLNILCIFGCFFIIPFLGKYLSWKRLATSSPIIIFILGASFFGASSFRHWGWLSFLGDKDEQIKFVTNIAMVDSIFGTFTKYVLFDNAKEQAWLGVDRTTQKQGKGPIDVVSSRSGKAASSIIHMIFMSLFMVGSDVTVLSPHLFVVFCMLIAAWIYSVNYMSSVLEKQKKTWVMADLLPSYSLGKGP